MHSEPIDGEDTMHHERREAPGRRAADIELQLASSAVGLARMGWRTYAAVAALAGACASTGTFFLLIFGLRVGGAADLAELRTDVLRRDSAARADALRRDTNIEHWRVRTDSVTSANSLRIAHLEEADRFKMFLLCNIAEQVGARSGGLCAASTSNPPKP